jgi:hypothetical protein
MTQRPATAPRRLAGIEESANFLILFRFGTKDGIDLIEEDRHAFLAANLAERYADDTLTAITGLGTNNSVAGCGQ